MTATNFGIGDAGCTTGPTRTFVGRDAAHP